MPEFVVLVAARLDDAVPDALGDGDALMHVSGRDLRNVFPGLVGTRATISRTLNFAIVRCLP
jgi:hypothetical protein